MCRMRRFLAVLRSFFHSSLLYTFSCHPSPPTILPSSLTSTCHLFLGLPLKPLVPKIIYNTLLGILFSSILCTCPNQHNLFNLIVSIIVGFLTLALISLLVNILQFSFSLSYSGPIILLYTFLSKMFKCFISLSVTMSVCIAVPVHHRNYLLLMHIQHSSTCECFFIHQLCYSQVTPGLQLNVTSFSFSHHLRPVAWPS